jgi:hypothetical protein
MAKQIKMIDGIGRIGGRHFRCWFYQEDLRQTHQMGSAMGALSYAPFYGFAERIREKPELRMLLCRNAGRGLVPRYA